jgi:hypothetical protein
MTIEVFVPDVGFTSLVSALSIRRGWTVAVEALQEEGYFAKANILRLKVHALERELKSLVRYVDLGLLSRQDLRVLRESGFI